MAYIKKYDNGEQPMPGDIVMSKKYANSEGKPVRMEVCAPCAFGAGSNGTQMTVALLDDHMVGYHNHATKVVPGRCFGMTYVEAKDVKFMHRAKPGQSIWDAQPERERFPRHRRRE